MFLHYTIKERYYGKVGAFQRAGGGGRKNLHTRTSDPLHLQLGCYSSRTHKCAGSTWKDAWGTGVLNTIKTDK